MEGRVLVVGLERQHYDELLPLLSRSLLSVDRIASGEAGTQIANGAKLDLIVVRYPLPDMAIGSFMQGVHQPGSQSDATPILVLADDSRLGEIRSLLPGGTRQALAVNQHAEVAREVATRLKLSPRAEVRIPVRLQVRLGDSPPLTCLSENISENGLLVQSDTCFPLGTRARFELQLPGERSSVSGEAEVVRHAEMSVERFRGMGLRIQVFNGDGAARVRRFLSQKR